MALTLSALRLLLNNRYSTKFKAFPGSSARISDSTNGAQHTSFASATVEVQY